MPNVFSSGQLDYIAKLNTVASDIVVTSINATVGGTTTLDCSLSSNFFINMGAGNTTIAFSNIPTGTNNTAFKITLYIKQDAGGSRTVTWPGSVSWPAATPPTLTITANKIDIICLRTVSSGSTWYGETVALNYT